jgi:glycine/D-amino acid oxidase-like deaminating enzyme
MMVRRGFSCICFISFFLINEIFIFVIGYEYLSLREDGRIIIGGGRHVMPKMEVNERSDSELVPQVGRFLKDWLPKHFASLQKQVSYEWEWTGIMGFTPDKLPLVGPIPERSNEFLCSGFSGHGMSRCFLSGKMVAQMIAADRDVDESDALRRAFDPARYLRSCSGGGSSGSSSKAMSKL